MSEKVALCPDYMRVWPIASGMNPILSAFPTVRQPQDNSPTLKAAAKQGNSEVTRDWRPVTQLNNQVFHWKNRRFVSWVLSGFIWKTTLEHNLRKTFFQQNKIFKPGLTGTRFPLRAQVHFFFFKHYPNALRHIKYEYDSIDLNGQAIRALQSLAQI